MLLPDVTPPGRSGVPGASSTSAPTRREAPKRQCRTDLLLAIPLMCVSFAIAWSVGVRLLEARGILQLDVWFHLDTDDLLMDEFSELVRHPNLGLFVRRPVSSAAGVLTWLGIGADEPDRLFYWLMLLVAPAAAALRTLAAYRSLSWLTGSVPLAILFSLLDISAFATIAIGSVPESYALTAASIAAFHWLFATDVQRERVRWGWWFFGHHYFMYAMHWGFSMVWIMAGVAFLPGRARSVGIAISGLLLPATVANSGVVLEQLLADLRAG